MNEIKETLKDEKLILLVRTRKCIVATVAADGYSEIALYKDERDDNYYIHTNIKYEYMNKSENATYKVSKQLVDKVFNYIKKNNLPSLKNNKGIPLCGGDYIIEFKNGDEYIILDSSKLTKLDPFFDIYNMLYAETIDENRC